jgi:3-oxoacyl-ACP reductase-like protein
VAGQDHLYPRARAAGLAEPTTQLDLHAAVVQLQAAEAAWLMVAFKRRMDLQGRAAVVTGGARGIGRAIAARFVAAGATVVIADLDRAASADTAAACGSWKRAAAGSTGAAPAT